MIEQADNEDGLYMAVDLSRDLSDKDRKAVDKAFNKKKKEFS